MAPSLSLSISLPLSRFVGRRLIPRLLAWALPTSEHLERIGSAVARSTFTLFVAAKQVKRTVEEENEKRMRGYGSFCLLS